MQRRKSGWRARWLYNGANLITLMRLPCLVIIIACFWPLLRGEAGWAGLAAVNLFLVGAMVQVWGMILDGLDGWWAKNELDARIADLFPGSWWARHFTATGSTNEGQFLDQFVDKIFVWVTWFVVCSQLYIGGLSWVLLWWGPSVFLFALDCKSCLKHWRNYVANRGKAVDTKNNGAKWQGKWKFIAENVVICMALLALCPPPTPNMDQTLLSVIGWTHWLGASLQSWTWIPLFIAIGLACWSLWSRGVKVLGSNKPEKPRPRNAQRYVALDKRPDLFAEASSAEGPDSEAELDPV